MDTGLSVQAKVLWIIGFTTSVVGLIFQALIYFLIPCSRKLDLKILTQLTVTRLLHIALEYVVACVNLTEANASLKFTIFALYEQADAVLVSWMFVFTKNLYDGVMNVFAPKTSFTLVTVIIWCVTIPVGLLCPFMLELDNKHNVNKYFKTFYMIYACMKFVILIVNMWAFVVIFRTAMSRSDRVVSVLRTCVVSCILISISSVQMLVSDVLTAFADTATYDVSTGFAVINSYQVIAITIVFVIITQKCCKDESMKQKIIKKFVKQTI